MKTLLGAALVAGAVWSAATAAVGPAVASAPKARAPAVAQSAATDFGAQRYDRRHYRFGHGGRPYVRRYAQPYYYARPTYYRPYPYVLPAPFPLGIGYGPYW